MGSRLPLLASPLLAYILKGDAEPEAAVSVPACADEGPVCNLERLFSTIHLSESSDVVDDPSSDSGRGCWSQ